MIPQSHTHSPRKLNWKAAGAILLFLFGSVSAKAEVKLPAIIADNMVLQQKSEVALWGWAAPGERVQVMTSWLKEPVIATADASGKWLMKVKTAKAGGPYSLTFSASNKITVSNVLLGEVWLASGQSNMEFPVAKSGGWRTGVVNHEEEVAQANYPKIRYIDVQNLVADTPNTDFKGVWKLCSPQTMDTCSAVAYFFARKVQEKTGYPIGIINATWGGTPAESWTRKDILENDADFKPILDRYQQTCDNHEALAATRKEAYDKWKADSSKDKGAAPAELIGPTSNKSPYKLYNGMIHPLIPYTLKGVIWYQGENNAERAYQYRRLFPAMIQSWRNEWKAPELPFYFVQIAPHRSQNPVIREAQLYTYRHVPHTGMAVTTDYGDEKDIHPRDKKPVGERLARWALHNEYGEKNLVTSGPLYKSMKVEGNKIRIRFDDADGLMAKGSDLKEFTISGADQQFVPAKAVVDGNTIVVESDAVKNPVAVRFGWSYVPNPNLFNKEGLPASPFRTDDWPVQTQGKN